MVAEIARLRREQALRVELNRLTDENAALRVRGSLLVCPNCEARVREDRLQAHISTRCPMRKGSLTVESPGYPREGMANSSAARSQHKRPNMRPREHTDEERQEFFERSLWQGGLCDGR